MEACQQLMDRDLLGTRRLAVVRDDFDRHQVGGWGWWMFGVLGWCVAEVCYHSTLHPVYLLPPPPSRHHTHRTACTWTACSPPWAATAASCWRT